jgi:dTDP-4-amino-4,6-dideoxygalactose transaminase
MMSDLTQLAVNGGEKTIKELFSGRSHFGKEEKEAVDAVFDQAIQTGHAPGYNGAEEEAYCKEFAEFMGGGFADGVNSGTTSVYVALRALNLEPFTEVIVGAVTDPGGIMPIPLMNCIPVVADTEPGSYNVGPKQIEELITPLTSAIVVAHIGGEPADIEGIMKVAQRHNLPVVEDCSQSHGAEVNGRKVGSFGDIAGFSTMFGKHHCTGGQGGVVFTKSEELYYSIRRVADRGKPFGMPGHRNVVASLNFNLNEISVAIGRAQLRKLPEIVERRRVFVALLKEKGLGELKSISIPETLSGARHSYWWWRLEFNADALTCSKDEFLKAVQEEGVELSPSYRSALPHTFEWYKNRSVFGSSGYPWKCPLYKGDSEREYPCPNAEAAMDRLFNLNVSESWGEEEAELIVKAFSKVEAAYV